MEKHWTWIKIYFMTSFFFLDLNWTANEHPQKQINLYGEKKYERFGAIWVLEGALRNFKHDLSLPCRYKWTKLWRKLVWWCRRWRLINNGYHKFIDISPAFIWHRRGNWEFAGCTLQQYQAQAPNVTFIVISSPTNSLRLQNNRTWKSYKFKIQAA
jgi:hypothetical protein